MCITEKVDLFLEELSEATSKPKEALAEQYKKFYQALVEDPQFQSKGDLEKYLMEKLRARYPEKPRKNKSYLVGKWFHTIEKGRITRQGTIIAKIKENIYLVKYFDWLMGDDIQKLVNIEEMGDWILYDTHEDMKWSREYGVCRRGGPYDKE